MYNIADKMITGYKFDFAIFAILTLQIPIACFDMCYQVGMVQIHICVIKSKNISLSTLLCSFLWLCWQIMA